MYSLFWINKIRYAKACVKFCCKISQNREIIYFAEGILEERAYSGRHNNLMSAGRRGHSRKTTDVFWP